MRVIEDSLDLIGHTPIVRLKRFSPEGRRIYVKLETHNPGGSVKDRPARAMIERAEAEGRIRPGKTTLVEASSGNTGIGLAVVAAVKGYRLVLVMPEHMPRERRLLLEVYGAEVVLTPADLGMEGRTRGRKDRSGSSRRLSCLAVRQPGESSFARDHYGT